MKIRLTLFFAMLLSTAAALAQIQTVNIKQVNGTNVTSPLPVTCTNCSGGGVAGGDVNIASYAGAAVSALNPFFVTPGTGATWAVTGTFWQATQPISIADGSSATLGAKGDAKSTSTDTTAISIVSILKEISAMEQAPASRAVTGTFWQATQPVSIASMPSTPVTGTFWQATQPVSIASMPSTPVTGTFFQATQPVSGTVTANAGSGTFTNQQSNITADYDSGAGTQTLTMFGVALPASGGAVAGGTSTNPLQVSLANTGANGTAVKVDGSAVTQPVSGTFWQATQPVSGTFWQATQPVSGTFWQATQPVSIASMPSTPVTGTFWQATQPVSGTFFQATQPVSGTFFQATQPVSIADGSEITLGAKADAKSTSTDTTAISIVSILKEISAMEQAPASRAVTGTFWQATQPVSGTFWQATQPSSIADGSDTTLGAKADAKSTATDTTAVTAMSVLKEISAMEQAPASRAVTGTFWQATQPVSGTFWQATQPVSGTVTANAGTGTFNIQSNASVNTNQIAGSAVSTAATGVQLVGIEGRAGTSFESTAGVLDGNIKNVGGSAVVASVTGVQNTMPVKRTGATGLAPNYSASHITTKTTTTITAATAYISACAISVTGAGSSQTLLIQNKEATPKVLYTAGAAIVVGNNYISFPEPILMTSGIDIVTGGTTAGTQDVFCTYWQ